MSLTMIPVESSNVAAVWHDPGAHELHVTFKNGSAYIYSGVSVAEFHALLGADSVGGHLHAHIKGAKAARKK